MISARGAYGNAGIYSGKPKPDPRPSKDGLGSSKMLHPDGEILLDTRDKTL